MSFWDVTGTQDAPKKPEETQQDRPEAGQDNLLFDFGKSAVSSGLELFGADPLDGVEKFRAEHPILGLGGDLLVPGGIYVKGYKALRKVDKLESIRDSVGDLKKFPITTQAARETITMAPIEAARLAGAALAEDGDNFTDTLASAGFNLALTYGAGALVGAAKSYGKRVADGKAPTTGADLNQPRQIQLRQVYKQMADETDDRRRASLQKAINQLEQDIRMEYPQDGKKLIEQLSKKGSKDTHEVRRLLNSGKSKSVRMLSNSSERGLGSTQALREAMNKIGFTAEDLGHVQYPRLITINTPATAKRTEKTLRKQFGGPVDGMYIGKERDGLYTVFKKLDDNEYAFFKTDTPYRFMDPSRLSYMRKVAPAVGFRNRALHASSAADAAAVPALKTLQEFRNTFPQYDFRQAARTPGRFQQFIKDKLGGEALAGAGEAGSRLGAFARRYFYPWMFKGNNNPTAVYLRGMAKTTKDTTDAWVQRVLHGTHRLDDNLYKFFMGNVRSDSDQSLFSVIDDLIEKDVDDVWKAVDETWSVERTRAALEGGEISEEAAGVLALLRQLDETVVDQIQRVNKIRGGRSDFVPLENHLAVARTWRGDYRIPVLDDAGHTVHVASGHTRKEALDEAEHIVQGMSSEGKQWSIGKPLSDQTLNDDIVAAAKINTQGSGAMSARAWSRDFINTRPKPPKTFKDRQGIDGYIRSGKQELKDVVEGHLRRNMNFITRESFLAEAAPDLMRLADESPEVYAAFQESVESMFGQQGKLSAVQNTLVDKVMSPVLGKDSASKIVAATNSYMMNFQLGMGNLQFPLLNAVTFMQTTLPQVAFVMNAPAASKAKYYSYIPAMMRGELKGSVSFLDSMKLGYESMRQMRNATGQYKRMVERAALEGVVDPRLVEEYIGEGALQAKKLGESLKESHVKGLKEVSEFLPGASEKFARTHTFTVGYKLAKDLIGIEDPKQIYQFAKEFTHNTMFLYSSADRARAITGPVGSLFGMFKNWQMHYMGWMMEYAGQGVMNGNWSPLMWQIAGTGALGGLGGLPLMGVAEAFSEWATGEGVLEHTYDMFGADESGFGNMADAVFFGLPAFFGINLQDSSAAPLADPARDASMLFSFVQADRAKALGEAVGEAFDVYNATGEHPIKDRETRDAFMRALAPRSFYRAMSVAEGNYVKSMRNSNPQVRGLSGTERMLVAAGFNPTFVSRSYEFANEAWQDQEKYNKAVQTYGKLWAEALRDGDSGAMKNLHAQMTVKNIDFARVMRSAAAHRRRDRQDLLDKTPELLQERGEYLRR